MVIGQYTGSVLRDKRVSFPKKLSQELGKNLLITKGIEKHLIIVSRSNWRLLAQGVDIRPYAKKKDREMQAYILENTFEIELDESNRFTIPKELREYADIKRDVIFTGLEQFVRLWDREQFRAYQEKIHPSVAKYLEELSGIE